MGADISGDDTDTLVIRGVSSLNACEYTVMPDRIEAGTYLVAAAATGGCITVEGADAGHLGLVLTSWVKLGLMCKLMQTQLPLT